MMCLHSLTIYQQHIQNKNNIIFICLKKGHIICAWIKSPIWRCFVLSFLVLSCDIEKFKTATLFVVFYSELWHSDGI